MAAPVASRFLQTLTPSERSLLERAMETAHAAGAALDPYSTATYARFCVQNKWDAPKTTRQVEKTVAWRTAGDGIGVERMRAELLSGVRFLELGDGVGKAVGKLSIFIPGHPFLGVTRKGDPFEVCAPGRIGVSTIDGKGFLHAATDQEFWTSNLAFME